MKHFETVYKELEELLIKKLPEYIEKINKKYNDNLILKPFENTNLEENCIKQPCFKIAFISGEYSEKDRIIENTVFTIYLEIILQSQLEKRMILFWRYVETISNLLLDYETDFSFKIERQLENKIYIRITQDS